MYFVVTLAIFIHAFCEGTQSNQFPNVNHDCTKVPPMCRSLKSINPNYTKMWLPNMLNHSGYEEVVNDLAAWRPLLNSSKCNANNQLKLFLCLTYAPVCIGKPKSAVSTIAPCKPFCENVRDSCDPVMKHHNHSWPGFFNCDDPKTFYDDSTLMCINLNMTGLKNIYSLFSGCSCQGGSYKRKMLKSLICLSDFVFRGWVTKNHKRQNQIEVKVSDDIFRQRYSEEKISKNKSFKLYVVSTTQGCRCKNLRVTKKTKRAGRYLIIGRYLYGGKMQLLAINRMKSNDNVKKIVGQCST